MVDGNAKQELVGEVVVDGPIRSLPIYRVPGRFEVPIGEEAALLEFRANGSSMAITHTEVPRSLRGQGIGEALARAALDDARTRGLTVKPYCPFVARYVAQHPDYAPLIDPAFTQTPTGADDAARE